MKNLLFILIVLFSTTLFSCVNADNKPEKKDSATADKNTAEKSIFKPSRITVVESKSATYMTYEIVKIDNVEYLSTTRGGVCPLVK